MLYEIMRHLRNFFPTNTRKEGSFVIEDGKISLLFVKDDQYILIEGSDFNDGVYKYPVSDLADEAFDGEITVLAPPREFLELVSDIEALVASNKGKEGFASESFGGYTYTKATNSAGNIAGWSDVFKDRLAVWRKI